MVISYQFFLGFSSGVLMSVRVTVKNKILRITFLGDSKQFPTLSRLSRILYMGFRATLSSESFKVTSYPVYQNQIISKKIRRAFGFGR